MKNKYTYYIILSIITLIVLILSIFFHYVLDFKIKEYNLKPLENIKNIEITSEEIELIITKGSENAIEYITNKNQLSIDVIDDKVVITQKERRRILNGNTLIKIFLADNSNIENLTIDSKKLDLSIDNVTINNINIKANLSDLEINKVNFVELRIRTITMIDCDINLIEDLDTYNSEIYTVGIIEYGDAEYRNKYTNYISSQRKIIINAQIGKIEIKK